MNATSLEEMDREGERGKIFHVKDDDDEEV